MGVGGGAGQTKKHLFPWEGYGFFLSNNTIYMTNSMSLRPLKLLFPHSGILWPLLLPPLWQVGKYIDSQEFFGFCQHGEAQQLPLTKLVVDLIFSHYVNLSCTLLKLIFIWWVYYVNRGHRINNGLVRNQL